MVRERHASHRAALLVNPLLRLGMSIPGVPSHQSFSTEILCGGVEVIEQVATEWRSLCDDGQYHAPFYQPEWIAAYVRAFAGDQTVFLITARLHGRLIAVLPLIQGIAWMGGIPLRKLRSAGNVHTCRFDLIHRPDIRDWAVNALWHALASTPGWDALELSNVPYGGAAADLVRLARGHGHGVVVTRAVTSPYLSLDAQGGSADAFLDRIDAKFRSNLRRRMGKLRTRGPVELVCTSTADERLAQFYALERAGWKGHERSAVVCDSTTRQFYDEVAKPGYGRTRLRMYSLECAGRPVAMYYGLRYDARYFLLKTAYDESLRECSPGQLITQEVLRALSVDRCVEFDFLGQQMDWKRAWRPRLRPHANWHVFRGPVGQAAHRVRFQWGREVGRRMRSWVRIAKPDFGMPQSRADSA